MTRDEPWILPPSGVDGHEAEPPSVPAVSADLHRHHRHVLHPHGPVCVLGAAPDVRRPQYGPDYESWQRGHRRVCPDFPLLYPFVPHPPPQPGVRPVQCAGHGQGQHRPYPAVGDAADLRRHHCHRPCAGRGAVQAGGAGADEPAAQPDHLHVHGERGVPAHHAGAVRRRTHPHLSARSVAAAPGQCRGPAAQRVRGREAAPGQMGAGGAGPCPAGRGLLAGRVHPRPAGGAVVVLRGGDHGHSGHLSAVHHRVCGAVPRPAEESPLLLPVPPLRVRVLHGLPHEAQRRGACQRLRAGHHGAGDAVLHHLHVLRRGGRPAPALCPGHQRGVLLRRRREPHER